VWREALTLWKLSLVGNLSTAIPLLLTFAVLNLILFVPVLGVLLFPVKYYLLFAYTTFVSKRYVEKGGNESALLSSIRGNPVRVLLSYFRETLAILVGQVLLTITAVLIAFLMLFAGWLLYLIKPLLEGREMSIGGFLLAAVLSILVYLSVVSSFPLFFGRAMLRGRGFIGTLRYFLSSLYAEVSWRTLLSCDYLKSSLVVSLIALLLFFLGLLFSLFGPFALPFSFLSIHLIYLFGTVSAFRLLRS
jgi:hypothetical protein